jgi:NAD(P)-dependent dehydrogenase (short-subunit alcohol dehydrogenase family)
MLLENKNAIIYGGGGGIGGGVARTFAREGANVFLAGRTGPPMEAVAADIKAAGGSAEVAVLDPPTSARWTPTWRPSRPAPAASTCPSTSSRVAMCRERHLSI